MTLRGRDSSRLAVVCLISFAALTLGIRDSGVRCDGPDCYDSGVAAQVRPDGKLARQHPSKQRLGIAKEVLLAGGESLLSQAAPVPQWQELVPSSQLENTTLAAVEQGQAAQSPQAGCKLMGIDCEPLLRFWLVACGLFMLLPLSLVCVFRGRLNLCAEISDEKKAPMPDVTAIRTEEALDESAHFTIRFKDDGLERMWDAHNNKKRVEAGTFTLFLLTGVVIVYQMLRLYWLYHTPCMQPIRWDVQACKFSCFGALLVLLRVNLSKGKPGPKKDCAAEGGGEAGQAAEGSGASAFSGSQKVFWFALAFYFFFIPAINMPPLTWSCHMLQDSCVAYRYDFWFIGQAVRHVDCTLSGPTALQMMITWLIVQPWVMPRYEMIHVCWLWILLVYVGWTVAWTNIADKQSRETYDMYHIFHRTLTLSACTLVSTGVKWGLERTERLQFLRDRKQREASKSMFLILEDMMPMHVIPRMMKNEDNIADQIDRVSILFVLIADFDQVEKDLQSPARLLAYLNEKFSQMDEICLRNRVTKIETVKEEYVAAVGVDPEDVIENKAKGHGALLRRLLQASGEIMAMQTEDTKFKMGVHTGPIVAGVMQTTKLPRYRLFGNTINTAARMMQKAPPGQLQFGDDTRQDVPEDMVSQVTGPREVEMKGKGKVQAYIFNPGNDFKKKGKERNLLGAVKAMTLANKVVKMRAAVAAASSSKSFSFLRQKTMQTQKTATSFEDKGPVSRLLDAEVDDRFQVAVGDLLDDEAGTPVASGWQWMSERKDFKGNMEEEWAQQHHKEHMCKHLAARFGLESVLLLMISASELPSMFRDKVWEHDHALYGGKWRIVVFIYLRGAVIFISIFWWYIADTRMHWIEEKRRRFTWCFVATYCLSAVLLYFSYDAFVCSDTKDYRDHLQLYKKFQAPHDQIYMLNFLLFFFFISQQHAMLFWPSLSFVFTALFLSCHDHLINSVYPELKFEAPISFLGKLMFIVQAILNTLASYTDEQQSRKRFKQQRAYGKTKQKTENILNTLMPEMVVQEISDNPSITTPSHEFRRATVAQSDLCGFTKLASNKSPQEVVCFMGELFGAFDILTDKHGVYKVETVGDAYIAGVAEFPLTKENSPIRVVLFALDMVREVDKWAQKMGGIGVTCRVGVDYGRCLGGIVGETMQRYHLFGDLLSTMEILESTAPEGRVQISTPCKEEIDSQMADGGLEGVDEEISFTMRKEEELRTSKDEVHDYTSVRGRTYIVESNKPLRYQDAATSL